MNLNQLPPKVISLGKLIGLLTGSGNTLAFNASWFSNPVSNIEGIPDRMNDLVSLIIDFLGTQEEEPGWYPIPNPKTNQNTPFYLVTTTSSATSGEVGLGWMTSYTENKLTLEPYVYIPLITYTDTGITFVLNTNPCKVGITGSAVSGNFSVTSGSSTIQFDNMQLEGDIYLANQDPTINLSFKNLQGASFTSPVTSLAELQQTEVLACIGELLLQATNWLNTKIGPTNITIGQVLTDANFLTNNSGTYSLNISNLSGTPSSIALNFVSAVLAQLASSTTPIFALSGGGIYVQEQSNGNNKTYGLQFIAQITITEADSSKPTVELCIGEWLSGEDTTDNWMTRSAPSITDIPAGLLLWLLNEDNSSSSPVFSFAPAFSLGTIGVNIAGSAGKPLFDLKGYTMQQLELRATVNPVTLNTPSTWQYGFAGKFDKLGFPMVPDASSGSGSSGNPVAQSLLQANNAPATSTDSSGNQPGDEAPANPTFGVAASWFNGNGIFDVQLYDDKNKPASEVDFMINRQLGPLNCQQINVGWENASDILSVLFDGSVAIGPLKISLQGLTIGIPVSTPQTIGNYSLDLQGLGINFNAGSVSLDGAFVKVPASTTQPYTSYDGTVAIQAGTFAINALGSYAYVPATAPVTGGYTSLFIFGTMLEPLGGPEFFFVTGLAAGFGYNRGIVLPDQNSVPAFPFVAALNDPTSLGATENNGTWTFPSPTQVLSQITDIVPPQRGEYWLAAGIKFTSFSLINTSALLTVEFGNTLQIGVTGISWMSLPPPPKGSTSSTKKYAYIELGIEIEVLPDEGVVMATAILSPNSYVIDPNCHLTGGFALYAWFGNNPHAGQFVLTIGGYYPTFNAPAYFPQVPRLGFNWNVSEHVTISGDAYFALTPSAIMAGGGLSVVFSDGNLKAWFISQMDALVQWAPFQYQLGISISIGVSYKLNLLFTSITLKVELGASVHVWGPRMGGKAHISWAIISFTVPFGADKPDATLTLDWTTTDGTGFADTLLPQQSAVNSNPPTSLSAAATSGSSLNILNLAPVSGLQATWVDPSTNTSYWVVRPASFAFSATTAFPLTEINVTSAANETAQTNWQATSVCPAGSAYAIYVRPMNVAITDSSLTLELYDDINKVVYDLAADFDFNLSLVSVPAAKWGPPIAPASNGMAGQPEMNSLLSGILNGFSSISPAITQLTPNGANALNIDSTTAFANITVDNPTSYLPLSSTTPATGTIPQVESDTASWNTISTALLSTSVTATRTDVYTTLVSVFGIDPVTNGSVSNLAAQPGAYLNGSPMIIPTT
jgi:hypothetical protein